MNKSQRPNFVLVCIAVVLLSFSFAGEMLCSLSPYSASHGPLAEDDLTAAEQLKPSIITSSNHAQPASLPVSFPTSFSDAVMLASENTSDSHLIEESPLNEILVLPVSEIAEVSTPEAIEASSNTAKVIHHSIELNKVTAQSKPPKKLLSTHAAAKVVSQRIAKLSELKPSTSVAIKLNFKGYFELLPSSVTTDIVQHTLKKAIDKLNSSEVATNEIELTIDSAESKELTELESDDSKANSNKDLVKLLRKLSSYSSKEKIYVLKGMTAKKIKALRQILNAHNVTLRAFIKA